MTAPSYYPKSVLRAAIDELIQELKVARAYLLDCPKALKDIDAVIARHEEKI